MMTEYLPVSFHSQMTVKMTVVQLHSVTNLTKEKKEAQY
jgi:hypothetical protein